MNEGGLAGREGADDAEANVGHSARKRPFLTVDKRVWKERLKNVIIVYFKKFEQQKTGLLFYFDLSEFDEVEHDELQQIFIKTTTAGMIRYR